MATRGRFRAWWQRVRANMREHPAAPFVARVFAYGLALVLLLVVTIALKDSPLRGYSAIVGALAAMFIGWKILRALKRGTQILRPDDPREGLFRRMFSVIRTAKKL